MNISPIGSYQSYDVIYAGNKGIEEFKKVVNKLYKEREDIARAYVELTRRPGEELFYEEGHGHYV